MLFTVTACSMWGADRDLADCLPQPAEDILTAAAGHSHGGREALASSTIQARGHAGQRFYQAWVVCQKGWVCHDFGFFLYLCASTFASVNPFSPETLQAVQPVQPEGFQQWCWKCWLSYSKSNISAATAPRTLKFGTLIATWMFYSKLEFQVKYDYFYWFHQRYLDKKISVRVGWNLI